MKKKITIEGTQPKEIIEKFIVPSCLQLSEERFYICGDDLKVEQVPETWEELKELCKNIKGVKVSADCISIGEDNHETYFLKDGTMGKENGEDVWWNTHIAVNRKPAQMYQIIKNLIGEEIW